MILSGSLSIEHTIIPEWLGQELKRMYYFVHANATSLLFQMLESSYIVGSRYIHRPFWWVHRPRLVRPLPFLVRTPPGLRAPPPASDMHAPPPTSNMRAVCLRQVA